MNVEPLYFERPILDKDYESFVNVAAKSEEVDRADIVRGCRNAEYLLWIGDAGVPISVAALKKPDEGYKAGIFEKAQIRDLASQYRYEYGYAFTEIPHRKKGRGEHLLQESLRLAGGEKIYATVRVDNGDIHSLLSRNGFERSGKEFASRRKPGVMLALFLR